MHKTKGSSIASVIVVMEEYYWNEYDFSSIYASCSPNTNRSINSKKLIYVACSRAQNELACIRIIKPEEENEYVKLLREVYNILKDDEVLEALEDYNKINALFYIFILFKLI